MVAWSIPGNLMLSVQLARPVTRFGSSLRGTPPPMYRSGAWVTLTPLFLARLARGLLDGLDNVLVARAAAVVALQSLPDLLLARVRFLLQEAHRGHDHAGRTVPALERVLLMKCRLHGMPLPVFLESLHRRKLMPVGLHREDGAGLHRL